MTISLLAAAYLFFGGVGAGTLFWALLLPLCGTRDGSLRRNAIRALAVGLLLLVLGIVCLVFDLGRPNQALLLFTSPTFSFLTVGAYLLAVLFLIGGSVFAITLFANRKAQVSALFTVIRLLGALIAVAVMVYTGLLLRDLRPVHLWTSWWLPVLFLLSSMAGGAACVLLCASPTGETFARTRSAIVTFARIDLILVIAEALVCTLYLVSVAGTPLGAQSVHALIAGDQALLFWGGFVLCGIAIPAATDATTLLRPHSMFPGTAVFSAAASLIGCFCLRICLVLAGAHVVI